MAETLTLSVDEIAQNVFDAFKVQVPMLSVLGTDLSSKTAKLNDDITARITKVPSSAAYDATNGYEQTFTEANALVVDVNVKLDQHKHVTVKLDYLDSIKSKIDLYNEAIANMAFGLAKPVVQFVLDKILATNFSESTTEATINTSKETLGKVTKAMNVKGASPLGRYGIVSSAFFEALDNDSRISSGDYYGQRREGNAYGHLQNIAGFSHIFEYPELHTTENLAAFFGTKPALVLATRVPEDAFSIAEAAGIPKIASSQVVTDPDSGLSMLVIKWMKSGTFDVWTTFTMLYGASAGKQAQTAGEICDYAGHRVVTA